MAYASVHGTTLLDRRLYLPETWVSDRAFAERRRKCRVPTDVAFQTKPALALAMIQAIIAQGRLRCRWGLADEAFGRDTDWLDALADLGLWYRVEVPLTTHVWMPHTDAAQSITTLVDTIPAEAWEEQTIGSGSKGRRIAHAVIQRVHAMRRGVCGPAVWVVLRIDPESGERKAFLSNAPAEVEPQIVLQMTGMRWPVEHIFEVAKQELGMGDYEVRGWRGWHHHMTLVILAHFFLVRLQRRLKKSPSQTRLLLITLLPLPQPSLARTIELIHSYQHRAAAACASHSRRTEAWIANMHEVVEPGYRVIAPPIRA